VARAARLPELRKQIKELQRTIERLDKESGTFAQTEST
jgi:prefoldin subunit 5